MDFPTAMLAIEFEIGLATVLDFDLLELPRFHGLLWIGAKGGGSFRS